MATNVLITSECPFYIRSNGDLIHCEAGLIHFDTKMDLRQFGKSHCLHLDNSRNCPTYQGLMREYEMAG